MAEYLDVIMVLGVIIFVFAFPSAVGAFYRGDAPRVATIAFMVGGGMMAYAHLTKPGGYKLEEIPEMMWRVFTG